MVGARGNLWDTTEPVKDAAREFVRSLRIFTGCVDVAELADDLEEGRAREPDPDQGFADPVALSSTHLDNFPARPCDFPVRPSRRASI